MNVFYVVAYGQPHLPAVAQPNSIEGAGKPGYGTPGYGGFRHLRGVPQHQGGLQPSANPQGPVAHPDLLAEVQRLREYQQRLEQQVQSVQRSQMTSHPPTGPQHQYHQFSQGKPPPQRPTHPQTASSFQYILPRSQSIETQQATHQSQSMPQTQVMIRPDQASRSSHPAQTQHNSLQRDALQPQDIQLAADNGPSRF